MVGFERRAIYRSPVDTRREMQSIHTSVRPPGYTERVIVEVDVVILRRIKLGQT